MGRIMRIFLLLLIATKCFAGFTGAGSAVSYLTPTIFTMTITGSTSNPTKATSPAIDNAYYDRLGKTMHIHYQYHANNNTGAAAGSGTYLFLLPNSQSVDTSFLILTNSTTPSQAVGTGIYNDGSNTGLIQVHINDSTHVALLMATPTTADVGSGALSLAGSACRFSFDAWVPISGWN